MTNSGEKTLGAKSEFDCPHPDCKNVRMSPTKWTEGVGRSGVRRKYVCPRDAKELGHARWVMEVLDEDTVELEEKEKGRA